MRVHISFFVLLCIVVFYGAWDMQSLHQTIVLLPFFLVCLFFCFRIYYVDTHIHNYSSPFRETKLLRGAFFCFELVLLFMSYTITADFMGYKPIASITELNILFTILGTILWIVHKTKVSSFKHEAGNKHKKHLLESLHIPFFRRGTIQKVIHVYMDIMYIVVMVSITITTIQSQSPYPVIYITLPIFLVGFFYRKIPHFI